MKVGIIGSGTMGSGIAQVAATSGCAVKKMVFLLAKLCTNVTTNLRVQWLISRVKQDVE